MQEFLRETQWLLWVAGALILGLLELTALDFVFSMLVGGALAAALAAPAGDRAHAGDHSGLEGVLAHAGVEGAGEVGLADLQVEGHLEQGQAGEDLAVHGGDLLAQLPPGHQHGPGDRRQVDFDHRSGALSAVLPTRTRS